MTIEEVKQICNYHHTAARREYISRKTEGRVSEYNGRFGRGYVIDCPRWDTTNYCSRQYWILAE